MERICGRRVRSERFGELTFDPFPVVGGSHSVFSPEDCPEIGGVRNVHHSCDFIDFMIAFGELAACLMKPEVQQVPGRRNVEITRPVPEEGGAGKSVDSGNVFQGYVFREVKAEIGVDLQNLLPFRVQRNLRFMLHQKNFRQKLKAENVDPVARTETP